MLLFPDMLHLSFANFGLKKKKKYLSLTNCLFFFFLQILTDNLFCFVFLLMLLDILISLKASAVMVNFDLGIHFSLFPLLIIPPLRRA